MKRFLFPLVAFLTCFLTLTTAFSQNAELEKLLSLDIEDLMDAKFVTASKSVQKFSEVAANVQIVTSREIEERGYQSLEDLLSDLPGFQFRNIQSFNSYVFQRGIPSQNNLILLMIDGVQTNELNSGGFYGGSQYNLNNIERVEIVYGPASAIYGTNAVSGIINLIRKKADDEPDAGLNFTYGSFNTFNASAGYSFQNKKKDFLTRVASHFFSSNKTPLAGEKGDFNWTDQLENFERDFSIDLTSGYKNLSLGLNLMNKQASRSTNYKSINTAYGDYGTRWNILFVNGFIQYAYEHKNYSLTPKLYYRNSTVLNNTISHVLYDTAFRYYRPGSLIGLDFFNQYIPNDNFMLTGGLIIEAENVAENFSSSKSALSDARPPLPAKPEMTNDRLISLYGQFSFRVIPSVSIVAGLRYDLSSYYGEVLTPRMSISYRNRNFTSRILYNEAFRAPRPWDFTSGSGNPGLKPETIKSIEWINTMKISKSIYLSLTLYKNYLDGIITVRNIGPGSWQWANTDKIETLGSEAGLNYRWNNFSSWINYTYNFSADQYDIEIPEISKHTINGGLHYYINERIGFGLRFNYFGDRKNASTSLYQEQDLFVQKYPLIGDAVIFHATASFRLNNYFEAFLIGNNLLNTTYYHTSNRPPDRYAQAKRYLGIQLRFRWQ